MVALDLPLPLSNALEFGTGADAGSATGNGECGPWVVTGLGNNIESAERVVEEAAEVRFYDSQGVCEVPKASHARKQFRGGAGEQTFSWSLKLAQE